MENIVFPKKYRSLNKHWCIVEFDGKYSGTVVEVESSKCVHDIGYYSGDWVPCDNKGFWEPVEEEHTISEKEPFPALDDIEWVIVEVPEWYTEFDKIYGYTKNKKYYVNNYPHAYPDMKNLYENSKDFKVTWKLKEKQPEFKVGNVFETYDGHFVTIKYITKDIRYVTKEHPQGPFSKKALKPINRKLHENKPLAMAIGRWLVETGNYVPVSETNTYWLQAVGYSLNNHLQFRYGKNIWEFIATLPYDYEIPEQVLQWMKEYKKEMK